MEGHVGKVKGAVIALGTMATSALGALAIPVLLMVVGNVIDYITGLMAAKSRGSKINSNEGFRGIAKKISMWLLVVVGVILDMLIGYAFDWWGATPPGTFAVGALAAIWLLCNELISILENISDMGVNIPPFLVPVVKWVKGKSEEKSGFEKKE